QYIVDHGLQDSVDFTVWSHKSSNLQPLHYCVFRAECRSLRNVCREVFRGVLRGGRLFGILPRISRVSQIVAPYASLGLEPELVAGIVRLDLLAIDIGRHPPDTLQVQPPAVEVKCALGAALRGERSPEAHNAVVPILYPDPAGKAPFLRIPLRPYVY